MMTELLFSLALTLTMLPLGFFFSCSLCCGCDLFLDSFATDQLATAYSQRVGTWTVSSGKLRTSSSNALLRLETLASSDNGVVYATVVGASGDQLRVVGNYVDDSNYLFAELEFGGAGANKLRLYARAGGVDTLLDDTDLSNTSGSAEKLWLCWNGSYATAIFTNSIVGTGFVTTQSYCRAAYTPLTGGVQCGVATGVASGSTEFDDLGFTRSITDNSTCVDCVRCSPCSDLEPASVEVTFAGVTNDICASCADWNVTWVLDPVNNQTCRYEYDGAVPCRVATNGNIVVRLARTIAGDGFYSLSSAIGGPSGNQTISSGLITCSGQSFFYDSTFTGCGGFFAFCCNVTNAEVTIDIP